MKADGLAIVFGDTIHLHGASRERFLASTAWVRHEVCHVRQYRREGYFRFLCKYLLDWLRHGYWNNKFEIEAREAEKDPGVMDGVRIL